jgi:hypothetical protein
MHPNNSQHEDLTSWKAIADYLGINVRTAQKWEAERGLPVHRSAGEKGRVSALSSELEKWKSHTAAKPQLWGNLRFLRYYSLIVTLIAVAALAILLVQQLIRIRPGRPAMYRLEQEILAVTDNAGRELWKHVFEEPLSAVGYIDEEGQRRVWFGDIDDDSQVETLFVFFPTRSETQGNRLVCFSEDGKVKWDFKPGTVSDAMETYSPHYIISGMFVVDFGGSIGRRIAVTSRHTVHYPSNFAILDSRGIKQGEYWHSGHLDRAEFVDLDGDKVKEVLLSGVNNGFQAATLLVLDPRSLSGASDQGTGSRYQLLGLPLAHERAVLLFPRTCINRKFELYNIGRTIIARDGQINLHVYERLAGTSEVPYVIYTLDYQLRLLRVKLSDYFIAAHRGLEGDGQLDHPLSEEEISHLREIRVLRKQDRYF